MSGKDRVRRRRRHDYRRMVSGKGDDGAIDLETNAYGKPRLWRSSFRLCFFARKQRQRVSQRQGQHCEKTTRFGNLRLPDQYHARLPLCIIVLPCQHSCLQACHR